MPLNSRRLVHRVVSALSNNEHDYFEDNHVDSDNDSSNDEGDKLHFTVVGDY